MAEIIDQERRNKEVRDYAQKGMRSQGTVNRIKEYLRNEGFEKIDEINDTVVASVERFPNLQQIKRDMARLENDKINENIKRLPPALREIERAGGVAPQELTFELMVRRGEEQPRRETRQGPWDTLQDKTIPSLSAGKTSQEELLQQYEDGAETFTINGKNYTIHEMRDEILSHMNSLRPNWPTGDRFEDDFEMIKGQIEAMNSKSVLKLFYMYDDGFLFRDIFDFDSEGDKANTRGIYTLKRDVASASSN